MSEVPIWEIRRSARFFPEVRRSTSTKIFWNTMKLKKKDENKNGGRKLLFRKAEKVIELDAAFEKKVLGEIQRSPTESQPTSYANAQAVSTIEEEVETKVL